MGGLSSFASLFFGLLFLSTAAPFFVASKMDPTVAGFSRLALSGVLLLGVSMVRHPLWGAGAQRLRGQLRRELPSLCVGALIFASHLLLWMYAFKFTTFASTVLFLVAQPALAAVVGYFFGERLHPAMAVSLGIAMVALFLVAAGDLSHGPRALIGDGMCVLAAFLTTLFVPVTRRARATLPLPLFLGIVFSLGAILLSPLLHLQAPSFQMYGWESWRWLVAMVLVSTIGGHGLTNLAARRLSLFRLNVVILLQPLIAIGIGVALFGLTATSQQLLGGLLLPLAVAVGLWGTRASPLATA